jgi:hypothetical protein
MLANSIDPKCHLDRGGWGTQIKSHRQAPLEGVLTKSWYEWIQQMRSLLVTETRKPFYCRCEKLALVHSSELHVNLQVLFVEHLE